MNERAPEMSGCPALLFRARRWRCAVALAGAVLVVAVVSRRVASVRCWSLFAARHDGAAHRRWSAALGLVVTAFVFFRPKRPPSREPEDQAAGAIAGA